MPFLGRVVYFFAFVLLSQVFALAGQVGTIFSTPKYSNVRLMRQDAAGNLYLAGFFEVSPSTMPLPEQALVSKMSPDGKEIFTTVFGGLAGQSFVTAMTVAADGSIAVAGTTNSTSFPVTADAAQPTPVGGFNGTGFFARLDASGKLRYASYLNSGSEGLSPTSLVLDSAGAAYLTGAGKFTSTSGALPPGPANLGWVAKLDATGKLVFGTGLLGGTAIALDGAGSIYVAGSITADQALPVTPGAFQSTVKSNTCFGNAFMGFACSYQYAAKLDAVASRLIYATWAAGSFGATPTGIVVDGAGNSILAGTTTSKDYPVTPGAYQEASYATLSPSDNSAMFGGRPIQMATTGFVTKLNAGGTALLFSTYLGGSGSDAIGALATDASGNVYLGGVTSSPDFPGLSVVPGACRPSFVYPTAFTTRLSTDGSALTETQLAYRLAPLSYGPYFGVSSLAQLSLDGLGKASAVISSRVATMDLFAPSPVLVCATDALDYAPLTRVAPGQLLSLFGQGLGPDFPVNFTSSAGSVPLSLGGVSATFNGTAAPILYAASGQVNLQVPYEVSGQTSVMMKVNYTSGGSDTLTFNVVDNQPSAFVPSPLFAVCGSTLTSGVLPLVLNADFTVNSCGNPAARGTSIYLFLSGLGLAGGSPLTGAVSTAATPLATDFIAAINTSDGRTVHPPISISADIGQINSVWQAKIDLPSNVSSPSTLIGLVVGGVSVRETLLIWTR